MQGGSTGKDGLLGGLLSPRHWARNFIQTTLFHPNNTLQKELKALTEEKSRDRKLHSW